MRMGTSHLVDHINWARSPPRGFPSLDSSIPFFPSSSIFPSPIIPEVTLGLAPIPEFAGPVELETGCSFTLYSLAFHDGLSVFFPHPFYFHTTHNPPQVTNFEAKSAHHASSTRGDRDSN